MKEFKCIKTIDNASSDSINTVILLKDNRLIAGGNSGAFKVWKYDLVGDNDDGMRITIGRFVFSMLQVKDERLLIGTDSLILIFQSEDFKQLGEWKGHTKGVFSLIQLENGLVVSGSTDCNIIVWDIKQYEIQQKIYLGEYDYVYNGWVEWRPNFIVAGTFDCNCNCYSIESGKIM